MSSSSSSSSSTSSSSTINRTSSSTSSSSSSTSSSTSWSSRSTQSTSSSSHSSRSSVSSSSSSSSYIKSWSSSSTSSSSYIENWSSSSSSYIRDWSSSSSSSSYLDYHANKTIPFTFDTENIGPIWTLISYGNDVYVGTGHDGAVLKSTDRQFWSQIYTTSDANVTALNAQNNQLFIGTSPSGYVYIMDLATNVTTLSQTLSGTVVDFCYFQNKMYAVTSSPSQVYVYNTTRELWEEFYQPYAGVINRMFIYNNKMYLIMDASNVVYFDGTYWTMNKVSDNVSSYRNVAKEPFSHVSINFLNRSNIEGLSNEEIYDVFPVNYVSGLKSAAGDGDSLILGSSNYGRVYNYFDNNLHEVFQTESQNTVHYLLNLDVGKNLAAIDNKLYLIYCGALTTTTATTTPLTTTETTTVLPSIINVTYPSTGVYASIGETITITWTSTKSINDAVKIELIQKGSVIQSINPNTSNNGSYDWTIPSITIGDYSIRITWLSTGDTSSGNQGDSGLFHIVYSVPVTTTTTTTPINTQIPDTSDCRGIPILDLINDEYITCMIKDVAKGGILFATSMGRILGCRESTVKAYLTGERNVYAEVKNGFGDTSDTAYSTFFYALYNRIAEINQNKEVVKWKFNVDPSAIMADRIAAVFLSPIMYVKEDLGIWKQLLWTETKPDNTEITICIRTGTTINDLQSKSWDNCFTSDTSDVLPTITRSLDDLDINAKYIQFKVTMTTTEKNISPAILYLSLTYTTKFAVYFFTVKFSLEDASNIKSGLMAANITQPQNTEIKFGICNTNSADWNDYKTVDLNEFFALNSIEDVKVGIKMISYDDVNVPEVAEFSLMAGGYKDNLIND